MTGIVFESYAVAEGSAFTPRLSGRASATALIPYGVGRVRFTALAQQGASGLGSALTPRVRSYAWDTTAVRGDGAVPLFTSFGADSTLVPSVAIQMAAIPTFFGTGTSISVGVGNQSAKTPRCRGFATAAMPGAQLAHTPLFRSVGFAVIQPQNFVFCLQSPGYVAAVATGAPGGYNTVIDRVALADAQHAAFIQAIFDLMRYDDAYATLTQALQALSDGMSLYDLATLVYTAGLLDVFIASGTLTSTAQITALLSDSFVFDETADAKSQILAAINDGLYIHVTLTTGQDTYTAWVMTPETKALRSYSNWPFNSYAQLDGMALAAGPLGVYRLGGKTDAGAAIMARVRSGLLNFGSMRLKRIDRAYLGYTSSGTLCLRVCALSETGDKTEYTYKMIAQPSVAPVEGRIPVGRGPRSVYWSFEICNDATGSDFELHDISVLPMVLTGRITG